MHGRTTIHRSPSAPARPEGPPGRGRPALPRLPGLLLVLPFLLAPPPAMSQTPTPAEAERPRARDIGLEVGIFPPGTHNAITDVAGVRVGHATLLRGDDVRTGVTAIFPHGNNPYESRVPAAIRVGNGFGKLVGVTQVRELGELETPVLLTCTLCVWRVADALVGWMLERPGMEEVRSLNAVVGETNDAALNDIRSRPVRPADVREALESAAPGPVAEGSVGAGTGTRAFGWKGGIGTSSRVLPGTLGGWTVGVLVQSNFGGILSMGGAPVGRELGRYSFQPHVEGGPPDRSPDAEGAPDAGNRAPGDVAHPRPGPGNDDGRGSIMIVVATDAPLSPRNLERLADRAVMGLARTGSFAGNGSGDYVIAFSTHEGVRRERDAQGPRNLVELPNGEMSPLFQAVVEATEEAIYNSLLRATTVTGRGRTADALPLEATLEILRRYNVVGPSTP